MRLNGALRTTTISFVLAVPGLSPTGHWSVYSIDFGGPEAQMLGYNKHDYQEDCFVPEGGDVALPYARLLLPARGGYRANQRLCLHTPSILASRGPRFPLAYSFDIAPSTVIPVPLPEVGTSGRIEHAPQTVDSSQATASALERTKRTLQPHLVQLKWLTRPEGIAENHPPTAPRRNSRASPSVAVSNTASPVAGPPNLRRASPGTEAAAVDESDSESDTGDDDDHAHAGTGSGGKRAKRELRTKVQVASVTRKDLPKSPCPVQGCETMFDLLTHDLKRHYKPRARRQSVSAVSL
ncbi:hypothetical protein TRAPUB_6922 [Trametes pubescens]|uniref:C2H2-type domain-containing protein n=1 Tax=Trametes pubescens TaxID=154538 RepID=A0A1M2V4M3_TRAPU|nr:hypothetical protein TRAPUB_6922 [Trametes pubescens]